MKVDVKGRCLWAGGVTLGLLSLLVVLGPHIEYKTVTIWSSPVCGSTRSRTVWFGEFAHEERTVSALEKWLVAREPGFQPSWQG